MSQVAQRRKETQGNKKSTDLHTSTQRRENSSHLCSFASVCVSLLGVSTCESVRTVSSASRPPPSPLLCISVFACLALFVLFLASLCSAAGRVCTARLWRYLLPCPPIGSSSAQHCRRSAFRTTGPPVSRLAIVLFWLHYPLQLGVRS